MAAQMEKRINDILYSIRMELMGIPRRPRNIHHYTRLSSYKGDVTQFYKTGFELFVHMKDMFEGQLKSWPKQGEYARVHERAAKAIRNFKELLYLLSDLVDTKPADFYAERLTRHLITTGKLIKRRIKMI